MSTRIFEHLQTFEQLINVEDSYRMVKGLSMTIISDSSSLILLARAEILKPLLSRRELKISNTVYEETVEKGKEKAKEDAYFIEKLVDEKEITVAKPDNSTRKRIRTYLELKRGKILPSRLLPKKILIL